MFIMRNGIGNHSIKLKNKSASFSWLYGEQFEIVRNLPQQNTGTTTEKQACE